MDDDNKEQLKGEFILNSSPETDNTPQNTNEEKPNEKASSVPEKLAAIHETVTASTNEIVLNHAKERLGMHKKPHFYSSLEYYPEAVTFENQKEDEVIILVIRQDFSTNILWILATIALALLPLIIIPLLPLFFPFGISGTIQILYTLLYYLVLIGFVITRFALWYFQVGIITNTRIIDVDIHGILIRDVARALVEDIQDVKYSQNGAIPSIFNYGDVIVQTAGEQPNFEFHRVPEPSLIIEIIQDLKERSGNGDDL